jgi:hypothetical protein
MCRSSFSFCTVRVPSLCLVCLKLCMDYVAQSCRVVYSDYDWMKRAMESDALSGALPARTSCSPATALRHMRPFPQLPGIAYCRCLFYENLVYR